MYISCLIHGVVTTSLHDCKYACMTYLKRTNVDEWNYVNNLGFKHRIVVIISTSNCCGTKAQLLLLYPSYLPWLLPKLF